MLVAGIVGFIMRRHGFGAAPLVMGLILGKMLEETLSQSMVLMDHQWWQMFHSPIVCLFFGLAVLSLGWPAVSAWRTNRKAKA
jgi:putative tricarboxylic transport membrane protein